MNIEDEVKALWSMDTTALKARYRAVFDREPRVPNAIWLRRRIASRLQEQVFGGLSVTALRRIDELNAELKLPLAERTLLGKAERRRDRYGLSPGVTITRHWRGRDLLLRVLEDGFELDGVRYPTLTAAVRGVTGSHWNPAIFFNLKARRKNS